AARRAGRRGLRLPAPQPAARAARAARRRGLAGVLAAGLAPALLLAARQPDSRPPASGRGNPRGAARALGGAALPHAEALVERIAPRERLRWAVAIGVLGAVWAGIYQGVRQAQHLALPHQLESDPATLAVPIAQRLVWATWNSLRAVMSLPAVTAPSPASRML